MISGLKGGFPHHVPSYIEISCPNCGGPAIFEKAVHRLVAKRMWGSKLPKQKNVGYIRFSAPKSERSPHRDRVYATIYSGLGQSAPSEISPVNYRPVNTADPLSTVVCGQCYKHEKAQLIWPDGLYYQLEYRDRRLWFFDRAHALAYLELLKDPSAQIPWSDWYHIELPRIFKDKAARKNLPAKMRKLLKP